MKILASSNSAFDLSLIEAKIGSIRDVPFKLSTFPGGEPHIQIEFQPTKVKGWTILQRINSGQDLVELACAVDAVRRLDGS